MNYKNVIVPVLAAWVWIGFSEFLRNQLVFHSLWADHYASLGLQFPSQPINGAVWGLWSLLFASLLYVLLRTFTAKQTIAIGWVAGFVMMWLVIGNLLVLPTKLLPVAVPLSLLETAIAV